MQDRGLCHIYKNVVNPYKIISITLTGIGYQNSRIINSLQFYCYRPELEYCLVDNLSTDFC